jgi:hypothetical protein
VTVRSRTPDPLPDYIPLVVIRRTGGSSDSPTFYDTPWINVQCWAAQTGTMDAFRAAHNLADDVRRVLWTAWANQTVTAAGWIRGCASPRPRRDQRPGRADVRPVLRDLRTVDPPDPDALVQAISASRKFHT